MGSIKMTVRRLGSVLLYRGFLKHSQVRRFQAISTSHVLKDTFFTKKHEWVRVEGNTGIVGVSAYAADALGDVKVEDGPALINQAPMAEGWLFSVNLTQPEQVNSLMNDKDYEAYLKDCEEH